MFIFTSRFPWIKKLTPAEEYSRAFHGTPFEKEVSVKTVGELAELLRDAAITNDFVKRTIVEYTLNVRLADIQASASKWSGWLSVLGAVLASIVSFQLGQSLANKPTEVVCACNYRNEQQPIEKPVQPSKPSVVQPSPAQRAVKENDSKSKGKQPNASTNP